MRNRLFLSLALLALAVATQTGCGRKVMASPSADPKLVEEIRGKLAAGAPAAGAADASADAGASAASGWATIKGSFKVTAAVPQGKKIDATQDAGVCGKHPLFDETVVVGKDGGLQGVLVYVRTPKIEVHESYAASEKSEVVLDNKDCRFEPHVSALRTTQTLLIKNSDPVGHNSKIDGVKNPGVNVLIPAGGASPQSLKSEEAVPIKVGCSIHPWMGGWVLVRTDPYATASDSSGTFTLANLPAGRELEFQLWHEKKGNLTGAECANVKLDAKGRFKLKLEADKELALDFTVPADLLK